MPFPWFCSQLFQWCQCLVYLWLQFVHRIKCYHYHSPPLRCQIEFWHFFILQLRGIILKFVAIQILIFLAFQILNLSQLPLKYWNFLQFITFFSCCFQEERPAWPVVWEGPARHEERHCVCSAVFTGAHRVQEGGYKHLHKFLYATSYHTASIITHPKCVSRTKYISSEVLFFHLLSYFFGKKIIFSYCVACNCDHPAK